MDKAVRKKEEREKHKTGHSAVKKDSASTPPGGVKNEEMSYDVLDPEEEASPSSTSDLKRKRDEEEGLSILKKTRTGTEEPQAAPPPPPPPPVEDMPTDMEDANLTPMDESFTGSFPEGSTEDATYKGKTILQANGHTSPMQLATPPTNGSNDAKIQSITDSSHSQE